MPLLEFLAVVVALVAGWVIGTVYPLWEPAEDIEPSEEDLNGREQ